MKGKILLYIVLFFSVSGFAQSQKTVTTKTDTVTFASGCFWCIEAKFSQLNGVLKVTSGYTGGHVKTVAKHH